MVMPIPNESQRKGGAMSISMDGFGREMVRVDGDIRQAISLFYTFVSKHKYAAEDDRVFKLFNNDAEFWNLQLYGLQQSMIIALGRIFDDVKGSFGINKLLSEAIKHPEFFSKEALRARRMIGLIEAPDYLDEYIAAAYEPTVADLGRIHASLSSHRNAYAAKYGKIRSGFVAHAIVRDRTEIDALFNGIDIADAFEMFKALTGAMHALYNDLWSNGREPVLGSYTFTEPERIERVTRAALGKLVANSNCSETAR
jgi:hypothetical protein